jgi:hypothetical protein
MTVRSPFTLRRYDLDDPGDVLRARKHSWHAPGLEAAWPVRGARRSDKNPPPPPSNGGRASGARPS